MGNYTINYHLKEKLCISHLCVRHTFHMQYKFILYKYNIKKYTYYYRVSWGKTIPKD